MPNYTPHSSSTSTGSLSEQFPAGQTRAEGALGNTAKFVSAGLPECSKAGRWRLQTVAAELLPAERVAHCCRTPHGQAVHILHTPGAAHYGGLQTCGSVWACPVCAAKVTERRRQELGAAIQAWEAQGGCVLMATYTLRHRAEDTLAWLLAGLLAARKRLRTGRAAQAFDRRYGVVGSVRALEVTWSERNGWHPHVHELLFVEGSLSLEAREALQADLQARWSVAVDQAGLRAVNEHGCRVQLGAWSAAEYVAKFGVERSWGSAEELTKQACKRGKVGSLGPQGLLVACLGGDAEAGARYVEYAKTLKGSHQLRWSPGLRDRLGLAAAKSDRELAEEPEETAVLLCSLSLGEWRAVVAQDLRAELLAVASQGRVSLVTELLVSVGVWRCAGQWGD